MRHEWHIKELSIGGTGSGGICDPTDVISPFHFGGTSPRGGVETIIEDDYGFIHADVLPSYADLFLPELGKMDDDPPLVGDDDEVEDLYESAGHAGTVIISPGGDPGGYIAGELPWVDGGGLSA